MANLNGAEPTGSDLAGRLADFLDRAARTPFAWGEFDCCIWLAEWLIAGGLPDPAAEWRGRYATRLGATRLIRRAGGVEVLIRGIAEAAGLRRAARPGLGDVGLIEAQADGAPVLVGAICTGPRWASLTAGGLDCAPAVARDAWSL